MGARIVTGTAFSRSATTLGLAESTSAVERVSAGSR